MTRTVNGTGQVVVVDGRPPPDELDAHRRRAAVEVVGLDLPRPTPAAYNEPAVNYRADDEEDHGRHQRRLVDFLPVEWFVDVPLAVAAHGARCSLLSYYAKMVMLKDILINMIAERFALPYLCLVLGDVKKYQRLVALNTLARGKARSSS